MKFVLYPILIVIVLTGVNSAPKNDNNNDKKKCKNCRVKGKYTLSQVCGRLGEVEETFDSRDVFECFAKCKKVSDFEFLYDGKCQQSQQTREQCIGGCDKNTPLHAPPACEGDPKGLKMTTHPYEALLDCYIKCPDNNLNKLSQGPCINDRHNPVYSKYVVLAPYSFCYNNNKTSCQKKRLEAFNQYPVPPVPLVIN